jgi:hypothetical protein
MDYLGVFGEMEKAASATGERPARQGGDGQPQTGKTPKDRVFLQILL